MSSNHHNPHQHDLVGHDTVLVLYLSERRGPARGAGPGHRRHRHHTHRRRLRPLSSRPAAQGERSSILLFYSVRDSCSSCCCEQDLTLPTFTNGIPITHQHCCHLINPQVPEAAAAASNFVGYTIAQVTHTHTQAEAQARTSSQYVSLFLTEDHGPHFTRNIIVSFTHYMLHHHCHTVNVIVMVIAHADGGRFCELRPSRDCPAAPHLGHLRQQKTGKYRLDMIITENQPYPCNLDCCCCCCCCGCGCGCGCCCCGNCC